MEWISVEDRLPKRKDGEYVLTLEYFRKKNGRWTHFVWIEESDSLYWYEDMVCSSTGAENITHWMVLPKPPEDE